MYEREGESIGIDEFKSKWAPKIKKLIPEHYGWGLNIAYQTKAADAALIAYGIIAARVINPLYREFFFYEENAEKRLKMKGDEIKLLKSSFESLGDFNNKLNSFHTNLNNLINERLCTFADSADAKIRAKINKIETTVIPKLVEIKSENRLLKISNTKKDKQIAKLEEKIAFLEEQLEVFAAKKYEPPTVMSETALDEVSRGVVDYEKHAEKPTEEDSSKEPSKEEPSRKELPSQAESAIEELTTLIKQGLPLQKLGLRNTAVCRKHRCLEFREQVLNRARKSYSDIVKQSSVNVENETKDSEVEENG